jgi:hypothetical protein
MVHSSIYVDIKVKGSKWWPTWVKFPSSYTIPNSSFLQCKKFFLSFWISPANDTIFEMWMNICKIYGS